MKLEGKRLKVCLAASSGGHLEQLLKFATAFDGHEIVFVTTQALAERDLAQRGRTYVVGECNREKPLRVAEVFRRCTDIARREGFDIVASTGAAPGLLMCLAGKLRGAKVIWVDSIANVEKLSLSGRLVRPIADLVLSQWESVARCYRGVEYVGAVV